MVKKSSNDEDFLDQLEKDKEKIKVKQKAKSHAILRSNEPGEIFCPPINDGDNVLVRIVKTILQEKQISLRIISDKFESQMELNNLKRSLRIHNKMSIERFAKWMKVLGYTWDINYEKKLKKKKNA